MNTAIDIQKIIKSDHDHLIHPLFHSSDWNNPFVWVAGEGATIRTADGRKFIDGLDVPEKVKRELHKITPANYTGLASRLSTLLN